MDPATRFDDEAVRRILARAADRQVRSERLLPGSGEGDADAGAGLTLAELVDVAEQAGIEPAHIQAAARELQLRSDGTPDRYPFLGIPKETIDQRVVPGSPDDREWEKIVQELRDEFRVPGITNSFGDVREWWSSSMSTAGGIRLRLEPGEDGTEVVLRRSNQNMSHTTHALGWTFGGMGAFFGAVVAGGGLSNAGIAAPIMFGALSLVTFGLGRLLSRQAARRDRSRFAQLLDRIELIARGGGS
ncbi:MAG: hypothetical protein KJO11_07785 [Gemmatimonadetes bacterium]|nr:hypothetical protein [Gemmatimonadota bacterium]